MDLGAIRSEIKAWERQFKSDHGRHPSVQDIKDADMASKYKLYKKLSKEAQPSASTSTSTAPSSRHKDVADGVILLPPAQAKETQSNASTSASVLKSPSKRSDAVSSTAPLASYNPFSPTKSRSHSKNAIATTTTTTTTSLNIASTSFSSSSLSRNTHAKNNNPFATPTKKSKKTLSFRTATQPLTIYEGDGGDSEDDDDNPFSDVAPSLSRISSEGPDELLETSAPSSSMVANRLSKAQQQSLDAPSSAVLRARKRLRGEPVSPSPNKKRVRVVSQTTLAFPVLRGGSAQKKPLAFSDEEDDNDNDEEEEEDVLAASPVKAPVGSSGKSKAFKHLFDEADAVSSRRLSSGAASKAPFPGTRNGIGSIQGGALTKLGSLEKAPSFSDLVRTASKRPREIAMGDLGQASTATNTKEGGGREASPEGFIPPSPPAKDGTGKSNKGKTVTAGSRKKTKMSSSSTKGGKAKSGSPSPSESSGSEDLSVKVKLVSRHMRPSSTKHAEEGEEGGNVEEGKEGEQDVDGDEDEDNRLGVLSRHGQAYHYARAHGKRTEEASTFTVSLPDRLRDVLSLEPPAALQASLTAGGMVVRRHEAWGVGDTGRGEEEGDDLSGDDEQWEYERYEDEEWEGEGVPWEIGEL